MTLDDPQMEALMVLLGTDQERLLYAAGVYATATDPGSLCLSAETLAHTGVWSVDRETVLARGREWWQEHALTLHHRDPAIFTPPSGDPRSCLQLLAGRIVATLGLDPTGAGLLAACVLQIEPAGLPSP